MCGRARLSSDVSEIKIAFGIPPERPTPNFAASWNVAPTDPLPVVRYDAKDRQRSLEVMRWGLIPYWAKDDKIGFSTINARAEEVDTKPAFREPFRQRRCLVRPDVPRTPVLHPGRAENSARLNFKSVWFLFP
jgi:putative SOS response-associated peptidase YedK